jgi:NADH:ubiquinone oxidoreductase subunit 5 (subunit L)/multisubunit Na+/H+ antiporter MnhA subunit
MFCYILGIISVFFTSSYSTRLLILVFLNAPNANKFYVQSTHENGWAIKAPLILLSFLSIIIGGLTADIFYGLGTTFYSTAIFFDINNFNNGDVEFMSGWFKVVPLVLTLLGVCFSFFTYLVNKRKFIFIKQKTNFISLYKFFIKKWYTDRVINQICGIPLLLWSKTYSYKKLDRGLLEILGPTSLVRITNDLLLKEIQKPNKNTKYYY